MLPKKPINVLLIEDEEYDVNRVKNTVYPFRELIRIKKVTSDGVSALEFLKNNSRKIHVVIMDFQIAGGLTGENLIREIKNLNSTIQVMVITKMTVNVTDFDFANRLLEAGAVWYCTKYPGDIEEYIYQPTDFILSIFNAYERGQLEYAEKQSRSKLKNNIETILQSKQIIGEAPLINNLKEQIRILEHSESPVLIIGESGTGKELVANQIHYSSPRKYEKFVPINCGSLPAELIESELFGYEKGAFTGAGRAKEGLFELANNGTVFLDEISELPINSQVKLLRVLQEGEIDKIGRTRRIKVNVRVIAATNKNLRMEVEKGNFREDLFYRINVATIPIPPLRERREDIYLLADFFLDKYSREMGRETPLLDTEAINALRIYDWPGNVRELQNVVQRLLLTGQKEIKKEQIIACIAPLSSLRSKTMSENSVTFSDIKPLKDFERGVRKKYFQYIRKRVSSDVEAAQLLGLAPPNYHRMCKELGLK